MFDGGRLCLSDLLSERVISAVVISTVVTSAS
jgi:hypothetical protein